jgi:hypothetical protein
VSSDGRKAKGWLQAAAERATKRGEEEVTVNKSVPTLLGIVIILLVVVLVVLIYNYKLTQGLGEGGRIVGTTGGELLTGEQAPKEFISETEALARPPESEARPSPMLTDERARARYAESEARRAERRAAREAEGTPPGGPAPE